MVFGGLPLDPALFSRVQRADSSEGRDAKTALYATHMAS